MSVESMQPNPAQLGNATRTPLQPINTGRFGFVLQVSVITLLVLAVIWGYAYWKTRSMELVIPWLNGERLLFEPTNIEAGVVPADQNFEKQIRVVNLSSRAMTLFGSYESCSCLSLDEFPITLEPGTERQLSVKMRAAKDAGPFKHTVKFFTNDPHRSSTQVSISGEVQ